MKEYLFRGKSIDNGEWVYGNLIYVDGLDKYFIREKYEYEYDWDSLCEVIPETVGQYIGRDDTDRCKVFEGDILENQIKHINQRLGQLLVITDIRDCKNAGMYINNYKVIGNIHDNPELLMGQWEKYDDSEFCYCSKCGKPAATDDNVSWHSYCPICGDKKQKGVVKV